MGRYDDIQVPVGGTPISSGLFGKKVRDAIVDLDTRVSTIDSSTGTGRAYSTSSLVLSTTTETAGLTIVGMNFVAGLAYEAIAKFGRQSAVATYNCLVRVRKYHATPASGADWGEFYRFEGFTGGVAQGYGGLFLINNTSADVVTDVNLNFQSNTAAANAYTVYANTLNPRYFVIRPIGFASDFVGMGAQVS